jgi:hypothetical protein
VVHDDEILAVRLVDRLELDEITGMGRIDGIIRWNGAWYDLHSGLQHGNFLRRTRNRALQFDPKLMAPAGAVIRQAVRRLNHIAPPAFVIYFVDAMVSFTAR